MIGWCLVLLVLANVAESSLTGIVAAAFTPFDDDLALYLPAVAPHAAFLQKQGIKNVLVAGTTGESLKMTPDERMSLLEEWVRVAPTYHLDVYVHVGDASVQIAQQLAAHAATIAGVVKGIVAISTVFFTPVNISALVITMDAIASAAPKLPFYYYHMPDQTHVDFNMYDLLVEVDRSKLLPTLSGIKATYYNLYDFTMCINYKNSQGKSYDMLFGRDETLLGALAMGCKGAVGSTYNYMGATMLQLWDAYSAGNMTLAQQLQNQNIAVVNILHQYSNKGQEAGKATMQLMGVNVGQPRLPSYKFSDTDYSNLRKQLEDIGITVPN
eukprot:TRINITY_DN17514_c0_g1_i1.p1 TRINITY_DN17514_c0_g1~~TRINITY_DN17514_c0_g1_i1.p1  ORF type:complete len:334 (-),score=102.89 TRINITY_DN17514_c0_g1_i1:231-1208(-)